MFARVAAASVRAFAVVVPRARGRRVVFWLVVAGAAGRLPLAVRVANRRAERVRAEKVVAPAGARLFHYAAVVALLAVGLVVAPKVY